MGTDQRIAGTLGFKFFASPDYGTCNATRNSNGIYDVTLKGKMSGYTDDYKKNFKTKYFSIYAQVKRDGTVNFIKMQEEK